MTLKEAYEIRRQEIRSLRLEIARLQKQTAGQVPVAEKEALERHIRHLEQEKKTLTRKCESAWEHSRLLDDIRRNRELEILDLKDQVSSLREENELLRIRAEKAEAEVAMLNGSAKALEKKLKVSFENSSLPSSALPFRKKIPNSRKPSDRKPGAQPGHRPHKAERLMPTESPVFLPAPEEFRDNPNVYATGRTITKQLIDIRFVVRVQDFIAEEYRDRVTGTKLHAPFPQGVVNPVNYGPSVKAMAFLLNNYYNVPVAKTRQYISDMTRGIVSLSAGTISNLSSAFSVATESDRRKIFSLLTHADVLYSDATVSNVNGSRKTVILCTDKSHVLYQHVDHKGHDGLSQTPVKDFEGTLVHDHDRTYYSYGKSHQECLAHVLRYLTGATEIEPDLTWHRQMHALIQEMIHAVKLRDGKIPRSEIYEYQRRYESILNLASQEYLQNPPPVWYPDGFNLQKRLRDYQKDHLYFLSHPGVDYTNNVSERSLRKFKRKQKQAVVLRSDSGGQRICDALTIIETARLQCKNVYDVVEAAFQR